MPAQGITSTPSDEMNTESLKRITHALTELGVTANTETQDTGSKLLSLPEELLVKIMTPTGPAVSVDKPFFSLNSKPWETNVDLKALRLTCKMLGRIAIPLLHQSLSIIDEEEDMGNAFKYLQQPKLCWRPTEYLKELHISKIRAEPGAVDKAGLVRQAMIKLQSLYPGIADGYAIETVDGRRKMVNGRMYFDELSDSLWSGDEVDAASPSRSEKYLQYKQIGTNRLGSGQHGSNAALLCLLAPNLECLVLEELSDPVAHIPYDLGGHYPMNNNLIHSSMTDTLTPCDFVVLNGYNPSNSPRTFSKLRTARIEKQSLDTGDWNFLKFLIESPKLQNLGLEFDRIKKLPGPKEMPKESSSVKVFSIAAPLTEFSTVLSMVSLFPYVRDLSIRCWDRNSTMGAFQDTNPTDLLRVVLSNSMSVSSSLVNLCLKMCDFGGLLEYLPMQHGLLGQFTGLETLTIASGLLVSSIFELHDPSFRLVLPPRLEELTIIVETDAYLGWVDTLCALAPFFPPTLHTLNLAYSCHTGRYALLPDEFVYGWGGFEFRPPPPPRLITKYFECRHVSQEPRLNWNQEEDETGLCIVKIMAFDEDFVSMLKERREAGLTPMTEPADIEHWIDWVREKIAIIDDDWMKKMEFIAPDFNDFFRQFWDEVVNFRFGNTMRINLGLQQPSNDDDEPQQSLAAVEDDDQSTTSDSRDADSS